MSAHVHRSILIRPANMTAMPIRVSRVMGEVQEFLGV